MAEEVKTNSKPEPKLGREAQDKINAAKKAKAENQKKAFDVIKELVDKNDPKYVEALKVLKPSLYGIQRATAEKGPNTLVLFLDKVKASGKVGISEDEIFKAFKLGRKECAAYIKKGLQKAEPQERLWIAFDATKGIYSVVATGPKAPANWKGFVPVDEKVVVDKK